MLSPESCLNECSGADQVTVWVQLGNEGAVPLTAGVTIKVYGTSMGVESLLQEVPVDIVLQPGEFAGLEDDVDGDLLEQRLDAHGGAVDLDGDAGGEGHRALVAELDPDGHLIGAGALVEAALGREHDEVRGLEAVGLGEVAGAEVVVGEPVGRRGCGDGPVVVDVCDVVRVCL